MRRCDENIATGVDNDIVEEAKRGQQESIHSRFRGIGVGTTLLCSGTVRHLHPTKMISYGAVRVTSIELKQCISWQ